MSPWHFTMERWPERAFSIRRRMREDARLREIIGEYEVARDALAYWRAEDAPGSGRVRDYVGIVQDLEDEIETYLAPAIIGVSTDCRSEPHLALAHDPRFTLPETREQTP